MSVQSNAFLADALVFVLMLYADLPNQTQVLSLSADALSLSFAASLVAKQVATFGSMFCAYDNVLCAYASGTRCPQPHSGGLMHPVVWYSVRWPYLLLGSLQRRFNEISLW